jgi:hypothetical protein
MQQDLCLRCTNNYERHPTIKMNQTYIHSSHTKEGAWSHGLNAGLFAPTSKRQ